MRKRIEKTVAASISLFLLKRILRYEESTSEVTRSVMAVIASKTIKSSKSKGKIMSGLTPLPL